MDCKNVHYDLEAIEAAIRVQFANAPKEAFADGEDVAEAMRRGVDLEVAFCKWFLSEVMRGTDPNVTSDAMIGIFVSLLMNRGRSMETDDPDAEPFIETLVNGIILGVAYHLDDRGLDGLSQRAIPINPVPSDRA